MMETKPVGRIDSFFWAMVLVAASSLLAIGFFSTRSVSITYQKGLPAPMRQPVYELVGRHIRSWNSNCIELYRDGCLHFVVLEGLTSPPESHPFAKDCRSQMLKLCRRQVLRVEVQRQDDYHREIGRVFINDLDLNLHLIESGHAFYNGNKFPGWEAFEAAEEKARAEGVGFWRDGTRRKTIPPCVDG